METPCAVGVKYIYTSNIPPYTHTHIYACFSPAKHTYMSRYNSVQTAKVSLCSCTSVIPSPAIYHQINFLLRVLLPNTPPNLFKVFPLPPLPPQPPPQPPQPPPRPPPQPPHYTTHTTNNNNNYTNNNNNNNNPNYRMRGVINDPKRCPSTHALPGWRS